MTLLQRLNRLRPLRITLGIIVALVGVALYCFGVAPAHYPDCDTQLLGWTVVLNSISFIMTGMAFIHFPQ